MLLKKCRRTAQNGIVKRVAKVGDQPIPGVVHQVGARVIEDSLEDRRSDKRESHDCPCIMKMGRNESLQIDSVMSMRNSEQQNVFRSRRWVQNAVKDWPDEQHAKCVQKPYRRQQQNRWNELPPIGHQEPKQPRQLAHAALLPFSSSVVFSGTSPQNEGAITCKPFYLTGITQRRHTGNPVFSAGIYRRSQSYSLFAGILSVTCAILEADSYPHSQFLLSCCHSSSTAH